VEQPQRPSDPGALAQRLVEVSTDARAAVLLDASGEPAVAGGPAREQELVEGARELMRAVDRAAGEPPAELEAQVLGGSIFAVRGARWTLVAIARRSALASLMLYDMRALLGGLEQAA